MKFFTTAFLTFFSFNAMALELINPWKGGSQGVELNQILVQYLEKNKVNVKVVDIDNCRLIPTVWKQYKSPITISWSDTKDCNTKEVSQVTILSQAGQMFCSSKQVDFNKKPLKIGWQASAPLTGLYEAFDKKYGLTQKIPYTNSGQQIQGAIAGEIDIALIGQGSALTSSLNCFLTTLPVKNINIFEYSERDQYLSLLAVLYEDKNIKSLMENFASSNEIKEWREKRITSRPSVADERHHFLSNTFDRR